MDNKHYVVVGGSHGIGFGLVTRLAEQGQVTVLSRESEQLADVANVQHHHFDVMTEAVPADALPESIDGLAYCPGSINLGPLRGVKPEAMLADFQLNAVGAVTCLQAALPAMKKAGASSMLLFSTVAVAQGLPMHTSVAAAKGAVEGLTRSLAAELAPKVRVNCLAPALTATPLAERLISTDEKRAAMAKRYPLGRIGEVDDLASIGAFLLGPESSWITGQIIGVDGGMSSLRA